MKSERPASFGLVKREARVVEGCLIEEIGDSVRSGAPDQRRDCVDAQSKPILGLLDFVKGFLQRLPCEVLLGDIDMRIYQLGHVSYLGSVDDAREPRTRALELSTNRKNRLLRAPDLSLPHDDKDFRQAIGGNSTGCQSIPKSSASQSLRCAVDEVRRPAMHDVAQLATGGLLGAPFHRAQIISDHVAKT